MQQEKKLVLLERLRMHLDGKRIVLGGLECSLRQNFLQDLKYLAGYGSVQFQVLERLEEAEPGDYILLFNQIEPGGSGSFRSLDELMRELERLKERKPKSVVLVTDQAIYGKIFGKTRLCREQDMGYICHTAPDGMSLQYMRTVEHLACRIAREEGLAVKAVRAGRGQSGEALVQMILAALCVLVWGTDGEVYNLPVSDGADLPAAGEESTDAPEWTEDRSPLSPMQIKMDCSKEQIIQESRES